MTNIETRQKALEYIAIEIQEDPKYAKIWRDHLVQIIEDNQVPKEVALRITFKFLERVFPPRPLQTHIKNIEPAATRQRREMEEAKQAKKSRLNLYVDDEDDEEDTLIFQL